MVIGCSYAEEGCRKIESIGYGLSKVEVIKNYYLSGVRGKIGFNGAIASRYSKGYAVLRNSNVYQISPESIVDEAKNYVANRKENNLKGVGFDDFMSLYISLVLAKKESILFEVLNVVQDATPPLDFGVTIYEDELENNSRKSASIVNYMARNRVDIIHLYMHKRESCEKLEKYINYTNNLFPNAKVFLGVYNYDRRYIEKRNVSEAEELQLFKICYHAALEAAKKGRADAIEFYPARFGLENVAILNSSSEIAFEINKYVDATKGGCGPR